MLLDLCEMNKIEIIKMKTTIDWIYLCKQSHVKIVIEIQLILFQQQTIITIKLRKTLLFISLITFLRQQNDPYLHLGRKFQNNKTDHRTFDFMLLP